VRKIVRRAFGAFEAAAANALQLLKPDECAAFSADYGRDQWDSALAGRK